MDWLIWPVVILVIAFMTAWRLWTPYGWDKRKLVWMAVGAIGAILAILWKGSPMAQ